MTVGNLIQAYREKRGLSVRELAKEIGIDHNALWRLERGEEMKDRQWVKVIAWMMKPSPVTTETATKSKKERKTDHACTAN